MRKTINLLYLLSCLLMAVSALQADEPEAGSGMLRQPSLLEELESGGFDLEALNLSWPLLERFYQFRRDTNVWHHNGRLNPWGELFLGRIRATGQQGLEPDAYHLRQLELMPSLTVGATLWLRELLLTDAFFRLTQDLHSGQYNAAQLDPLWHMPTEPFDPAQTLAEVQTIGELAALLDGLEPDSAYYKRLEQALVEYRQIREQGGWPEIRLYSTLRPQMRDPAVKALRARLQRVGDLNQTAVEDPRVGDLQQTAVEDPQYYDAELVAAVRRFQRRHGLVADGLVGPLTRLALNVPVEQRIQQIRANLERWRWMPQGLGDQYLLVNTAGFDIKMVVDDRPVFQQPTINGRLKRQTPSFTSQITHLVINPSWTVPRTIAVQDLLPKQQADQEFLQNRGIGVFQREQGQWIQLDPQSLDWSQYNEDRFPFMLRQVPGVKNSLGQIKFHMANPYAIFLHDTPVKSLFNKTIRAFSSGCVRVRQADQLALRLLDTAEDTLDSYLRSGETQIEKLSMAMPVYLVYFTSWVDEDGSVQFRPDMYKRNQNLLLALQQHKTLLTASNQPSHLPDTL